MVVHIIIRDIQFDRLVSGQLGFFHFLVKRFDDAILNLFSTNRVDRMRDVGVQFHSPFDILFGSSFRQGRPAIVAEFGPQVIFAAAVIAVIAHLPRRHRHEQSAGPLNDLDVANDKVVVEGHRAEGLEAIVLVGDKLDSNFGDLHGSCLALLLPSVVVYRNTLAADAFADHRLRSLRLSG